MVILVKITTDNKKGRIKLKTTNSSCCYGIDGSMLLNGFVNDCWEREKSSNTCSRHMPRKSDFRENVYHLSFLQKKYKILMQWCQYRT